MDSIPDDVVIHCITPHLPRCSWLSFMCVNKRFLRCALHHKSGIDPSVDNNRAIIWAAAEGRLAAVESRVATLF